MLPCQRTRLVPRLAETASPRSAGGSHEGLRRLQRPLPPAPGIVFRLGRSQQKFVFTNFSRDPSQGKWQKCQPVGGTGLSPRGVGLICILQLAKGEPQGCRATGSNT